MLWLFIQQNIEQAIVRLFRRLKLIPAPPISREQAVEIALANYANRFAKWQDQSRVYERLRSYRVDIGSKLKGCGSVFEIDALLVS